MCCVQNHASSSIPAKLRATMTCGRSGRRVSSTNGDVLAGSPVPGRRYQKPPRTAQLPADGGRRSIAAPPPPQPGHDDEAEQRDGQADEEGPRQVAEDEPLPAGGHVGGEQPEVRLLLS